MTNTFVAAGTDNPEEIVASTPYGIYVAQIKGGSVQPQSGEFNFSVNRAYLIEKGQITKPVKGAKLIGTGAEVLMNIDMVGQRFGRRRLRYLRFGFGRRAGGQRGSRRCGLRK